MTDSSASFLCPITRGLMVDPVIDPEGNSYERHAIEDWIRRSGTSPITRTALSIDDLLPNQALKTAIDEYRHSIQPNIQANPAAMKVQLSELTVSGSYGRAWFCPIFLYDCITLPFPVAQAPPASLSRYLFICLT